MLQQGHVGILTLNYALAGTILQNVAKYIVEFEGEGVLMEDENTDM